MSATSAKATRITLLVLYTDHLEESRAFYTGLGLSFVREQHGRGPIHYSATLPDGTVIELYPATAKRPVSRVRLGFSVEGRAVTPPLAPGRHVVEDPDGRAVELYVS
ncbi:VOC family protein [Streptomyces sp. NPDC007983]|uniref:VOC family protein n=1 Tax=Streptomyces sp. NPDC007983 TaxID=3364800 RepID=UPI0036E554B0